MTKVPDILFVDDEDHLRHAVSQTFELADLSHRCLPTAAEALGYISRDYPGIVITDIRMPELSGAHLLKKTLEIDYELPVVLVTGHGDITMAVDAMRKGAYDFIEKPFDPNHLVEVARRALDKRRLTLENRSLRKKATNRDDLETRFCGRTTVITDLRQMIRSVAPADMDVLVRGETGVGKEVVARAIHDLSLRAERPFVTVNCGGLGDGQVDSELFGHEQGAFPGAIRARVGKFEHARGGTIFLDGIENASPQLQAKLVPVLEEQMIYRLGGSHPINLDVRFIATSREDLTKLSQTGGFRDDLCHRLNAVTLVVPPLTQRKQDIPLLFTHLANQAARKYRRDFVEIPNRLLSDLMARDWPGNVRELKNAADRYVLGLDTMQKGSEEGGSGTLSERMAAYEKDIISAELIAQKGVLRETHLALGISRKSLYEKMQKYGIDKEDFRIEGSDLP